MAQTMGDILPDEYKIWAQWFFRKGRFPCEDCIKLKLKHNKRPDCATCGNPLAIFMDKYYNKENTNEKDKQKTTQR